MHDAFSKQIKHLEHELAAVKSKGREAQMQHQVTRLRFGWRLLRRYSVNDARSLTSHVLQQLCEGYKQHKLQLLRKRRNSISKIPTLNRR